MGPRLRAGCVFAAFGRLGGLDPAAHDRLGGGPNVELGIEVAGDAFDHDHGLLKHDQLGPGRHVEQGRDLEQQRQQARHRDLVGAPVVDRLADGPDRLREILDRVAGRNVARLEMHRGDAPVVAADEAEQDLGQEPAFLQAEPAHDAGIDRDEPALGIDHQVSRMHVGVEEAVADRLAQERLDHGPGQRGPVVTGGVDSGETVERDRVDPLRRQHVAPGQLPVGLRDAKIGVAGRVLGELGQGGRLEAEVDLDRDRAGERLGDLGRPEPERVGEMTLGQSRGVAQGLEIAREALARAGAHHLDREGPAVEGRDGAVNLGDRRGRDRLTKHLEELVERALQRCLDGLDRLRAREGRHPVLQALEVTRHRDPDDVGSRRQELPELDVGGPEPRQGRREPRRARADAALLDEPRETKREARAGR